MKRKSHTKKIDSNTAKKKTARIKREKKLDKTLEDTFPASDATAKY